VLEHAKRSGNDERHKHCGDHGRLRQTSEECTTKARDEQQHRCAEDTPELEARRETDQRSSPDRTILACPDPCKHPQERDECLRRMTVDEGAVRQAGGNRDEPDCEPDPVTHAEPAQDEQEQAGHGELDQERERREVVDGADHRELQRPGLEYRVGVRVGPIGREQLLALVDEVDEVARVRASIEGRHGTGGGEHW
jgi:hypothetical protein